MRCHVFNSSGEAYNSSQTDDPIRDGDVLLVPDEGRAAVVVRAWPVYVGGNSPGPGPAFHALVEDSNWITVDDGKYLNAAVVAVALTTVESMRAAGLPTERLVAIAREHGWDGEYDRK